MEILNKKTVSPDILDLLTDIVHLIFQTENPLAHAYEIVKQTALRHEADISTLLVVEGDSLVLKGGVAYIKDKELVLPSDLSYDLNWEATSQDEMLAQGLTAFVAASGKDLSIETYLELTDKQRNPAFDARWDNDFYPDGVDHSETGFGCLYAVPLRRYPKGIPKDTVIGVFKIERRSYRPPFTEDDRKVFNLVAAHLSLILQSYYHAQNRVFSDVAHAIGGGLGRSYLIFSTCEAMLLNKDKDDRVVLKFLEKHLPDGIKMLEKACHRLNLVLDASRDPDRIIEESIGHLWKNIVSEVELKANLIIDKSKVVFKLHKPLNRETKLRINSIKYHDLTTILGNLLDNAVRYSGSKKPVEVSIYSNDVESIVFRIADHGKGIPDKIIDEVKSTNYSDIFRLPGVDHGVKGTGLRRVYGLANYNNWGVLLDTKSGTVFDIVTHAYHIV